MQQGYVYFVMKEVFISFCKTIRIFAYSSTKQKVKQKVWNEAENREGDWGETLPQAVSIISLASHALRLLRHALPISLLILRKKTRLCCSLFYFFSASNSVVKRNKGYTLVIALLNMFLFSRVRLRSAQ